LARYRRGAGCGETRENRAGQAGEFVAGDVGGRVAARGRHVEADPVGEERGKAVEILVILGVAESCDDIADLSAVGELLQREHGFSYMPGTGHISIGSAACEQPVAERRSCGRSPQVSR
jgi:hypothetical protein